MLISRAPAGGILASSLADVDAWNEAIVSRTRPTFSTDRYMSDTAFSCAMWPCM
jgi:hypothetical protein